MIFILTIAWLTACFSAATSFFLDFAFGFPMSEKPNNHAILYPYILSLGRFFVKDADDYEIWKNDEYEVIRQAKTRSKWVYPLGYCVTCSNFWVSLVFGLISAFFNEFPFTLSYNLFFVFLYVSSIILTSHIILRKYLLV